jgi:hypothetical protein
MTSDVAPVMQYDVTRQTQPVAYVSIGNTDNKLTQAQWSMFVDAVRRLFQDVEHEVQLVFEGFAHPDSPYQNACWGLLLPERRSPVEMLRWRLARVAGLYRQDSIAWAEAPQTEFIAPHGRAA